MRTISCLGLVLASLGLFITGMPHLRLAAGLVSGQIDGTPISVSQLEHAHFQGSTVSIRCGALTLQVPLCATIKPTSPDIPAAISLEVESLKCTAFPPRESCSEGRYSLLLKDQEHMLGKDLIAWRAAICRASSEDFTFLTSAAEVSRLRQQLELRPLYCLRAERVEVFHGKDLSGLLLIWTNQGRPRMAFEYVSSNGSLHGNVVMFADADCDQAVYTARAILCALRIEPRRELTKREPDDAYRPSVLSAPRYAGLIPCEPPPRLPPGRTAWLQQSVSSSSRPSPRAFGRGYRRSKRLAFCPLRDDSVTGFEEGTSVPLPGRRPAGPQFPAPEEAFCAICGAAVSLCSSRSNAISLSALVPGSRLPVGGLGYIGSQLRKNKASV